MTKVSLQPNQKYNPHPHEPGSSARVLPQPSLSTAANSTQPRVRGSHGGEEAQVRLREATEAPPPAGRRRRCGRRRLEAPPLSSTRRMRRPPSRPPSAPKSSARRASSSRKRSCLPTPSIRGPPALTHLPPRSLPPPRMTTTTMSTSSKVLTR
jgi:hypothetical protein